MATLETFFAPHDSHDLQIVFQGQLEVLHGSDKDKIFSAESWFQETFVPAYNANPTLGRETVVMLINETRANFSFAHLRRAARQVVAPVYDRHTSFGHLNPGIGWFDGRTGEAIPTIDEQVLIDASDYINQLAYTHPAV